MPRNAGIAVNAPERHAGCRPAGRLARPEMPGNDVPDWRAALLVDRSPAGHLVALSGFQVAAIVELQVGDSLADGFRRRASIGQAAKANHVAALLVIGVGIE